jgi:hypothetical protein
VRASVGRGRRLGKRIVCVVGDRECRSEESMPALARILAERHGFKCTVRLPINRQTGEIDPRTGDTIPGLEALRKADPMVLYARFLEPPDERMKEIAGDTPGRLAGNNRRGPAGVPCGHTGAPPPKDSRIDGFEKGPYQADAFFDGNDIWA